LYDRYSRLVFGLALHLVGDAAGAEDVTQDVFLQVWRRVATYVPERGSVSTWLSRIARNRAIDVLRQKGVRPEGHSVGWGDNFDEELVAPGNVEASAELTLLRQGVRTALMRLPDAQRRVVVLAYFGGYSHAQIAALLNQPLGTVKTRIRLAMERLRRLLASQRENVA
jgi:RNA polymerase sigma-70 factor (ECF subfamily)